MNLRSILEEIISASGGRTYPGYPDRYLWVEYQDGYNEVIMLLTENKIDLVRDFNSATNDFPGERYVFALIDIDQEIYSYCISKKINCIKRDELINIIGRSVIDLSLKPTKNIKDVEYKEDDSIYIRLETGETPKFIKPQLSKDEIADSVGIKSELYFIPFHFYSYKCDVDMEGKIVARTGALMINSLNGLPDESVSGFELVDRWPFPHKEMDIKWEPDIAIHGAKKWISEHNIGYTVEEKETKYFLIFLRKKVEPLEDSIKIKFEGTYFYPFFISGGIALDGIRGLIYNVQDIF